MTVARGHGFCCDPGVAAWQSEVESGLVSPLAIECESARLQRLPWATTHSYTLTGSTSWKNYVPTFLTFLFSESDFYVIRKELERAKCHPLAVLTRT